MRLLITADAVGGVWHYALELARALTGFGVDPVIALLGPAPSPAQRASAGVPVIDTGLPLDWLCEDRDRAHAAGAAIAALAKREGADCVQLNSPALAACGAFAVPTIAVTHGCIATWWATVMPGPIDPAFAWHAGLVRAGLAAADRVVAPTARYAELIARTYDIPAPAVILNGRTAGGPPGSEHCDYAVTVGRLWDVCKQARLLDRVAARLPFPFFAAGATRGPQGETVTLDHLVALGHLDDAALAGRLRPRPIFVSAATFEPFGLSVLEAALAGCALVLADTPGFRELWDGAALFVAPGDEDGFTDALRTLAHDRARRTALGDRARARGLLYSPEAMGAGMAAILRDLVPAARAAA